MSMFWMRPCSLQARPTDGLVPLVHKPPVCFWRRMFRTATSGSLAAAACIVNPGGVPFPSLLPFAHVWKLEVEFVVIPFVAPVATRDVCAVLTTTAVVRLVGIPVSVELILADDGNLS